MILKGKFIVDGQLNKTKLSYELISNVLDYGKSNCIIIPFMNPDFTLLINKVDLIITQTGSALSHLATVAREYKTPVIIIDKSIALIPKKGFISLNKENENVEIKI